MIFFEVLSLISDILDITSVLQNYYFKSEWVTDPDGRRRVAWSVYHKQRNG